MCEVKFVSDEIKNSITHESEIKLKLWRLVFGFTIELMAVQKHKL